MQSPLIRTLAPLNNLAEVALNLLGSGELMATGDLISLAGENTCKLHSMTGMMCSNLLFLMVGFNSDQFNVSLLPEITKRTPAGASVKQILHFIQEVRSNKFAQYNHGTLGNMAKYGTKDPPQYPLSNVSAPLYLYYGKNDWLVDPRDVKKLKKHLSNIKFDYLIPSPLWNHVDFLFAMNAKKMLYDIVLANMKKSDKEGGIK